MVLIFILQEELGKEETIVGCVLGTYLGQSYGASVPRGTVVQKLLNEKICVGLSGQGGSTAYSSRGCCHLSPNA